MSHGNYTGMTTESAIDVEINKVVQLPLTEQDLQVEAKNTASQSAQVIDFQSRKQTGDLNSVRVLEGLLAENKALAQERLHRLAGLKEVFAQDKARLIGIREMETLENMLAEHRLDTLDGQSIQYRKSLLAVHYGLPLEFIQADTASCNIESINLTLAYVGPVLAKLNPKDENTKRQIQRLEELKVIKTKLVKDIEKADKLLNSRKGVLTIINRLASLFRRTAQG